MYRCSLEKKSNRENGSNLSKHKQADYLILNLSMFTDSEESDKTNAGQR